MTATLDRTPLRPPRRLGPLLALLLCAWFAPPVAAQGNVYLARSFFRQKKYEKVLRILETIDDPGPMLLYYRAESLAALDRRPEAVTAFKDLIARHPDRREAFDARRKVLLLLDQDKNYPALLDELRAFRAGDPEGRLPYTRLEADAQFKAGRYDEAIRLLEGSDDEADQRTLAEVLRELGRVEGYLEGLEPAGQDFDALRRRGLLFEHLKMPARAEEAFAAAAALRPGDTFCRERRAAALEGLDRDEEAMAAYRELARLAPREVKYASRVGTLLWDAGRQEEARDQWMDIVDSGRGDLQRARLVVRLFLDHQAPEDALKVIDRARAEAGDPGALLEDEERAHFMNRDPRSAVAVWVRVLLQVREPGTGEIHPRDRIRELQANGPKVREATWQALEQWMDLYPRYVEYYLLAVELLYQYGPRERLQPLMQKLIAAVGDDPGRLREFGARFRDEGRDAEAAALLTAAHARVGARVRPAVAYEAALALRAAGESARAAEILREVVEGPGLGLPPGLQHKAVDLYGRVLLEDLQQNLEARRHFTAWIPKVEASSPWIVPWVVLASRAASASGDFGAAQAAYDALLARGRTPGHLAEIRYRLGRLFLDAGKLEEARKRLREHAEAFPDSSFANDALAEVSWMLDHRETDEEALVRFLGWRHLVDAGRYQDFRDAVGEVPPEEVPVELRADLTWLEARALKAEGEDQALAALLDESGVEGAEAEVDSGLRSRFLWTRAEALERLGKKAEAAGAWKRFLLDHPDSLRLEEVRTRLAGLDARP